MTYGFMTKSFLNSPEHRQTKRDRKAFTAKVERGEVKIEGSCETVMCSCLQRPYPHQLSIHRLLRYESRNRNNEPLMRWPWTLRFLPDMDETVSK